MQMGLARNKLTLIIKLGELVITALNKRAKHVSGFTLIGVLAVLVTIFLLAGVLVPAVARANLKAVQIKCASHLRQLGVAAHMYAQSDGRRQFPDLTGAVWPWDLRAAAANALVGNGAKRDMFYCPGFPEQNNDSLWIFTTRTADTPATNGFRVIGYSLAFKGSGRVTPANITESLTPAPYRIDGRELQPKPSERVLIADAILSIGANEADRRQNRYTNIDGGWRGHRAPHLNGRIPAGGNIAFLDGHIEWRRFEKMRVRTTGGPSFWW